MAALASRSSRSRTTDSTRAATSAAGESSPFAENTTEVGRAENRRVEFHALYETTPFAFEALKARAGAPD